jgi:hypothetical protein
MLEFIASTLSIIWMLIAWAVLFGHVSVEEGNLLVLIALDALLLLVGAVALVHALRRKREWLFAFLICVTPLVHGEGAMIERYRSLTLFIPSALIVVVAIVRRIQKAKRPVTGLARRSGRDN